MVQQWPDSLLDLVEHVELNQSGWWDVALGNVLLAAVWVHGTPVHREQLGDIVASTFSLQIPADRITDGVARLLSEGKILVAANDHVFTANGIAEQMEARLQAARHNENEVRSTFVETIGECCVPYTPESAWDLFNRQYLLPLIEMLGARTLQFMGGEVAADEDVALLTDDFVRQFDPPVRQEVRSAVGRFLDPQNEDVRRYVTEHLDASFLVKASGLTSDAISAISDFGKHMPAFHLFLDTNFLFSLLDLHENPSNEATQMLGKTIRQVSERLSIQMSVIYPTVDEVKRTLSAFQYDLADLNMSPALADAALEVGLSGVAMRYVRAMKESEQPITAKEYFDPYLNNFTVILRSNGIEMSDEQIDGYKQRQDVVNDLLELAGVDDIPEAHKQRRYNASSHDSILWHVVHDKRPTSFEGALDAVFWLVTNDYRLLSFDRRRRRTTNAAAGVCIHPTELIQILRVWEPRSTDMEQALMSGLRLPFLFYEFDLGRESASMRILKILSRFEHIKDLEPDAIRDIVLNDAVRSRTVEASGEEEAVAVIRDALLAERKEVADQRDAAANRAKIAEETLASERQAALERTAVDKNERERTEARILELETELNGAKDANQSIGDRLQNLNTLLNERTDHDRRRSAIVRFALIRGVGAGLFTAAVASASGYAWFITNTPSWWSVLLSLLSVWLVMWFLAITIRVQDTSVRQWAPMRALLRLRRFAWWGLGPLLVAVLGNAIWQEAIQPFVFG